MAKITRGMVIEDGDSWMWLRVSSSQRVLSPLKTKKYRRNM